MARQSRDWGNVIRVDVFSRFSRYEPASIWHLSPLQLLHNSMLRSLTWLPRRRITRLRSRRYLSSHKTASEQSSARPTQGSGSSGFQKILSRTPKFLRPTISALQNAPVTHVTAFLLLHELTAIVPLFGLAGAFHYYNWLPPYFAEGAWVVSGVEKFGRYFRRRGWIAANEEEAVEDEVKRGYAQQVEHSKSLKWWNRGEGGVRWVVEFATAYAVVKALLPLRILLSVWGAPWFARWTVTPAANAFRKVFAKRKTSSSAPGMGAVDLKKP